MLKKNRDLLEEVTQNRLEEALSSTDDDKKAAAFKEAMEALNKQIEISKIDASNDEEESKLKEAKKDRIIRCVELGATVLLTPVLDYAFKKSFAKIICSFEKDYTFTTTAGKTFGGLFRFKR